MGNGDQDKAQELFEIVIDTAPQQYKTKAILSLAALSAHKNNFDSELYYFIEGLKTSTSLATTLYAHQGIAVIKAKEGFHRSSLRDLENLYPLMQFTTPRNYFDYLNSYAVELGEVGRMDEAENVSRLTIASPFAPYYPEWQSTYSEIRSSRKSRSTVTIPPPQKQVKPIKPLSNVLKFPTAQETTDLKTLFDLADINITPLQLLGVILKLVLRNRITDDEVDRICSTYYKAVQDMWDE